MKKQLSDHFPPIIENIIIGMILMVVIFTVVEDLAMVYNWPIRTVRILVLISFIFDIFFTAEFAGRSIISARRGMFKEYILHQRGWIDALSSFPLLLLVSLPAVLYYFSIIGAEGAGFSFLSILKTAKAIRVTRILRLIRIIKIFGKIQNTESVMTNRHIGIISTINVVILVIILVIAQFVPFMRISDNHEYLSQKKSELNALIQQTGKGLDENTLVKILQTSNIGSDVVSLKSKSGAIILEHPNKENLLWKSYEHGNFIPLVGEFQAIISFQVPEAMHAKENMIIFVSIIGLILGMMFFYSGIFAQQVADGCYIMEKGFREWEYNLEVKIPTHFSNDEVFKTAAQYNERWLPLKNQIYNHRKNKLQKKSDLKMTDLF